MTPVSTSRLRGFTLIELLVVIAIIAILAAILFPVFAQAREKARQTACLANEKQIGTALQMYAQDYDEGLPAWAEYVMTRPLGVSTPQGFWQAKLQPYIKNGDPAANNNTGVWQCPSLGAKGELAVRTNGSIPYSYCYNSFVMNIDPGGVVSGITRGYRYPFLSEMDMPASTVFVGEGTFDGRSRMPHEFAYWKAVQAGTVASSTAGPLPWTANEVPDRHNGGANYVFADGHAKWINAQSAYPKPANPSSPTTQERKNAYGSAAKFFAYMREERTWYTNNGTL